MGGKSKWEEKVNGRKEGIWVFFSVSNYSQKGERILSLTDFTRRNLLSPAEVHGYSFMG